MTTDNSERNTEAYSEFNEGYEKAASEPAPVAEATGDDVFEDLVEDIKSGIGTEYLKYTADAVDALDQLVQKLATLRSELEAAKHYKTVYEYVINLDMQHEMLDMLEAHTGTDGEKDLTSWGELYNAISELSDREQVAG